MPTSESTDGKPTCLATRRFPLFLLTVAVWGLTAFGARASEEQAALSHE